MAGDHSSFSFDTVAVLVAVLNQKGVSIGMKEFKMMSALDGERGASSFDHQFRAVKKRANELKAQLGDGAQASPAKATPRKGGKKAAGGEEETPASKKRGRKNQGAEAADDGESPIKKIKSEEGEEVGQAGVDEVDPFA